jgi:hypothetical protein
MLLDPVVSNLTDSFRQVKFIKVFRLSIQKAKFTLCPRGKTDGVKKLQFFKAKTSMTFH